MCPRLDTAVLLAEIHANVSCDVGISKKPRECKCVPLASTSEMQFKSIQEEKIQVSD